MNVIMQWVFELAYNSVVVQHVILYATKTPLA